jgi:hypothetical protein
LGGCTRPVTGWVSAASQSGATPGTLTLRGTPRVGAQSTGTTQPAGSFAFSVWMSVSAVYISSATGPEAGFEREKQGESVRSRAEGRAVGERGSGRMLVRPATPHKASLSPRHPSRHPPSFSLLLLAPRSLTGLSRLRVLLLVAAEGDGADRANHHGRSSGEHLVGLTGAGGKGRGRE